MNDQFSSRAGDERVPSPPPGRAASAGTDVPQGSSPGEAQPPKRNWLVTGGIAVVAVVLLFALLSALGVFETQPSAAAPFIAIANPEEGAVLPAQEIVTVSGQAGGLLQNNLIVQALDGAGNVLVEQPATVSMTEVGGTGKWTVGLVVPASAGTPGRISAYSLSPADGSILVSASVEVTYGETPEPAPTEAPTQSPTDQPQPSETHLPEETPEEGGPGAELIGPRWTLEKILPLLSQPTVGEVQELEDPVEGTTITLIFKEDKTLEANGGCNKFTGRYELNNSEIKFLDIVAQELPSTCATPKGTMDQEVHFIALLERVERYYAMQRGNDRILKLVEVRESENNLEQPLLEFKD